MKRLEKKFLEKIYNRYNKRELIHPDPLEFVYNYQNDKDREIAGLIASSLAYGRVATILISVGHVLEKLGPEPAGFIRQNSEEALSRLFINFRHRFTTGEEISTLLRSIKKILSHYDTLYNCFYSFFEQSDEDIIKAMTLFVKEIKDGTNLTGSILIPSPEKGSACKRLNLFLRWMVRKDNVDPGGWGKIPESKLIIPLDTHMHKFGLTFGLTQRKNGDIKTALEITEAFRKFSKNDPVKYDFSITRFGIREELSPEYLHHHG